MAVTKTFEELEKQLETAMEGLVKDRHDKSNKEVIHNACLILQAIREMKQLNEAYVEVDQGNVTLKKPESDQASEFDKVVQWLKYGDQSVKRKPPKMSWDEIHGIDQNLQTLVAMIILLPTNSVAEDEETVSNLKTLTSESKYSAIFLGRLKWDINKLLNPKTIQRSYSNAHLQAHMATVLFNIVIDEVSSISVVQNCPHTMPFLIRCLRGPTPEIRKNAAAVVSKLTMVDSHKKKIGESGVIKALIELIQIGDLSGTFEANEAILNLCATVVENRERAVSDGAVNTLIAKIKKGVLVVKMLETLEMLSWNEKVIAELEENGTFESLFMILGGAYWGMVKGYSMLILHTMCHLTPAKTRRIDEVQNGRQILQRLASTGTTKAREKASDLLWRLSLLDLIHSTFSK